MEVTRTSVGNYSVYFEKADIIDKKEMLLSLAYDAAMEVYEPTEKELAAEAELKRFICA